MMWSGGLGQCVCESNMISPARLLLWALCTQPATSLVPLVRPQPLSSLPLSSPYLLSSPSPSSFLSLSSLPPQPPSPLSSLSLPSPFSLFLLSLPPQSEGSQPASLSAYHPDELASHDHLALDHAYYLRHQLHAVVSRLCEPITGLDSAQIASCLGELLAVV